MSCSRLQIAGASLPLQLLNGELAPFLSFFPSGKRASLLMARPPSRAGESVL